MAFAKAHSVFRNYVRESCLTAEGLWLVLSVEPVDTDSGLRGVTGLVEGDTTGEAVLVSNSTTVDDSSTLGE